jgi:predicted RNA-binding Zn-ribbon protein involved in translation (DUF1610 family)
MDKWEKCICDSLKRLIAESKDGNVTLTVEGAQTILGLINPTETQKTGEWIAQPSNIPNVLWKCSECGTVIYSESEQDRKEFHKYCGKCGAVMT